MNAVPARDAGLQPERTALAWQRTGVAAAAVSLILGLTAIRFGSTLVAVLAAILVIVTLAVSVRRFPRGGIEPGPPHAWPVLVRIVVLVLFIAAAGFVLAAEALMP